MSESDSSDAPPLASEEFLARYRANEAKATTIRARTKRTKKPGARKPAAKRPRRQEDSSSDEEFVPDQNDADDDDDSDSDDEEESPPAAARPKRKKRAEESDDESDEEFKPDATPETSEEEAEPAAHADCEGCEGCKSLKARLRKAEAALDASQTETAAATLRAERAEAKLRRPRRQIAEESEEEEAAVADESDDAGAPAAAPTRRRRRIAESSSSEDDARRPANDDGLSESDAEKAEADAVLRRAAPAPTPVEGSDSDDISPPPPAPTAAVKSKATRRQIAPESDDDNDSDATPAQPVTLSQSQPGPPAAPSSARKRLEINKRYPKDTKVSVLNPETGEWAVGDVAAKTASCLVVEFEEDNSQQEIPFDDLEERVREPTAEDLRPKRIESEHLCGKCGEPCQCHFSPDKNAWFWACKNSEHGFDAWDGARQQHTRGGPLCHCDEESTRRGDEWVCAATTRRCAFSQHVDDDGTARAPAPATGPSDEERLFRVSGPLLEALKRLLEVSPEGRRELDIGCDCRDRKPAGYYDNLDPVDAWTIRHAERDVLYASFRDQLRASTRTELRPAHAAAVEALVAAGARRPLASANEVILLHGTQPDVVRAILKGSLDPDMGWGGYFGRGTYFAEDSVKINQYVTADQRDDGSLHEQLYTKDDIVPAGKIYYMLVAYAALGDCPTTRDGKVDATGAQLFTESPAPEGMHGCCSLRGGAHALVAEAGDDCKVKRYREVVVFEKDAINIKFLVAFRRTKTHCACGIPVRTRTFTDRVLNRQRELIACANSRRGANGVWEGGCGLVTALPRCFCPKEEGGDFRDAEPNLTSNCYACKKRKCGFREVLDPSLSRPQRPPSKDLDKNLESDFYVWEDEEPAADSSSEAS